MPEAIMTFLASLVGSSIALGAVALLGREWITGWLHSRIEEQAELRRSRYEIKRQACLEALSVIDAVLSHSRFTQDGRLLDVQRQPVDIAKARECNNKLALTCDDPRILELFLDALGVRAAGREVERQGDLINDVRERMRKELGFGKPLALPSDRAWIATLPGVTDRHQAAAQNDE